MTRKLCGVMFILIHTYTCRLPIVRLTAHQWQMYVIFPVLIYFSNTSICNSIVISFLKLKQRSLRAPFCNAAASAPIEQISRLLKCVLYIDVQCVFTYAFQSDLSFILAEDVADVLRAAFHETVLPMDPPVNSKL